jgi:Ca-activated chloride channel homolog
MRRKPFGIPLTRRTACSVLAGTVLASVPFAKAQQPQPAAGQAPAPEPAGTPIRVAVEEVIVPVTVTDEKGRFVSNLEQKDFEVLEEGKLQSIRYFSRERSQPVVVGFLLDLSNSSRAQWKNFQTAAVELVLTLMPGKEKYSGYLIGYGSEAELMVNTTTDPEPIVAKIRDLKPGGGAALYDAIYLACTSRALVKGEPVEPRRVLIVIGDGNDNASNHNLKEVIEIAQKNLVTIYGISTMAYGFNTPGDENLVKMAQETGGRVEYPLQNVYKDVNGFLSTPSDEGNFAFKVGTGGFAGALSSSIFRSLANVAGEVNTQYVIRYNPTEPADPEKPYREINVKVALPNVTVRARKGYYPNTQLR